MAEVMVVGEGVILARRDPIQCTGGDAVVDVSVDERGLCRLLTDVIPCEVFDGRIGTTMVDQIEHLVGVLAFQEHDIDPPAGWWCFGGGLVPGDPTGLRHRRIQPIMHPIQQRDGAL